MLNSASLEAVMLALMESELDISDAEPTERYHRVMNNEEFQRLISGSTTDALVLKGRIDVAKRIMDGGVL